MTVNELIQELRKIDGNKQVYVPHNDGEHEYYIAHSVREIPLSVLGETDECVVINYE